MIGSAISLVIRLAFILSLGLWASGIAMLAMRFPYPALVIGFFTFWRVFNRPGVSDSYGSASVSTNRDLASNGLLADSGVILGRTLAEPTPKLQAVVGLVNLQLNCSEASRQFLSAFFGQGWSTGRFIRTSRFCHLATVAPAGAGKNIGVIIPNLRSYLNSLVITDPKGENAKLSGWYRRWFLGNRVFYVNPFGLHGLPSASLNPLDFLNPDSEGYLDDCRALANAMVLRSGRETEEFWNDSCELMLVGVIAFVRACEPDARDRNFQTVRLILSNPVAFDEAVRVMQRVDTHHGVIKRLGGMLSMFQDREKFAVLATVQRHTSYLDSPTVARNTAFSSFDPLLLRRRRVTVYFILPHDQLSSLAGLQRMWLGTTLRRAMGRVPSEKNPVLWLLDEYAHIGNVPAISNAVTLGRGYGMRFWFFFQSREQMKTCFGEKATTIIDNIGTQQYFNLRSYETADEISKRIGETTIRLLTKSEATTRSRPTGHGGPNSSSQGNYSQSTTYNQSETGRRVLKPEEVLTLPKDLMLLFYENMSVSTGNLIRYYRDREFRFWGCGRQPGIGLSALLIATLTLLFSLVFAGVAHELASLPPFIFPVPADGIPGTRIPGETAGGFGSH